MGLFSKIWKGIKKTFKKIGKGIKKVFQKVGKFMNKIGIVGQIAMMFLPIPGLSSIFGALGKVGSKALGWLNKFGAIGQGAAKVLGGAYKFVRAVAKPFVDIGKGITGFITDTTKFVLNKIPGVNIASAPTSIFGEGGAWATAQERVTGAFKGFTGDIADAFSGNIDDLLPKPKINLEATLNPKTPEEMYSTPGTAGEVSTDIIPDTESFSLTPQEQTVLPGEWDPSKGLQMQKIEGAWTSTAETIDPYSFSMENVTAPAATPEALGELPVSKSLLSKVGEKALDKFASIPASLAQTKLGQAMGIYDSPIGEPGPSWSSYPSQFASQMYGAAQQAMQPLEELDIFQQRQGGLLQGDYGYPGMVAGMGYGGPDFNSSYEARLAKFAPSY